MKFHRVATPLLYTALVSFSCHSARADFSYTETTQVTGGTLVSTMKMMGTFSKAARQFGQPIESTVIVKGNRMTRINSQTTEIIDLDKGTITQIDNVKHQYTVMTFDQMKQQMDAAMATAKAEQAKQQPAAQQQPQLPPGTEVKFTVKVRNTDATKTVAGLDAKESILVMSMDATATATDQKTGQTSTQTGSLGFTNDMWLAPEIPGYKEITDFYLRMAEKMGPMIRDASADMTSMMAQLPPGAEQGMADMAKEMSKIKGVPVQTITRVGTTVNGEPLPAASEAPLPPPPPTPTAGDLAKQGATSAITNSLHLGGFGLGKKKAADPPPSADNSANAPPPTSVVMMETTTQLSSFSSASVDPSKFEVPAGYKQVDVKGLQ